MHSKQAGEWALGGAGWVGTGVFLSARRPTGYQGMPQNPISAMLKLARPPLASRQHHAGGGRRGQGHQPTPQQPQYPSTKVTAQALKHGPALWGGF